MATTDLADPTNSLLCAVRATNKEFDHYTAAFGALKNGGNPNGCTADSNSALMWAAWSDLPPVVRLLIQHGADVLYKNKSGQTALHWACIAGSNAVAKVLIDSGVPIDVTDNDGYNPFLTAARYNKSATTDYMWGLGSDIGCKDNKGRTALHHVMDLNHIPLVRLLIQRGANITAQDDGNR